MAMRFKRLQDRIEIRPFCANRLRCTGYYFEKKQSDNVEGERERKRQRKREIKRERRRKRKTEREK